MKMSRQALIPFCCSFHALSFNKAGVTLLLEGWERGMEAGEAVRWLGVMNLYPAPMTPMSNIYLTHSLSAL